MMTRSAVVVALAAVAGSASAQPDMLITIDNTAGDQWTMSAEYFGFQPVPAVQIWADAGFELTGDGL
ncbi:MAG: hypothetical protein AAFS11_06225 [Planctomycetota bacterium]